MKDVEDKVKEGRFDSPSNKSIIWIRSNQQPICELQDPRQDKEQQKGIYEFKSWWDIGIIRK
jgi:hypothetical protein